MAERAPPAEQTASLPATTPHGLVENATPLPVGSDAGRYRLIEEIARGGMGEIHRAHDDVLDREVAAKVLQARYAAEPAVVQRFIDEARISGQLQHPCVPAVHDLGALPDGRPFLILKLIKGRTLDDLLKERAPGDAGLIAVFEPICQAVAYAHARGVIHRDLKPSNVMVGAFGEVQVMDWGLAKVVAGPGKPAAETASPRPTAMTEIRPARDSDLPFTQYGAMIGTPAYMPPEQAGGEVDRIDERADIFGLGAILCAILTGQPPYVAADGDGVRLMAVRGQTAECLQRLSRSAADPGLIALCRRCLAFDPAERPANAGELARAVAELRAAAEERARQAELEQAGAQAEAREQRRRRRVQLALAVSVSLTVVVAAGSWAWVVREEAERDKAAAREQAERDLAAAQEQARRQGQAEAALAEAYQARAAQQWADALAQVRRAEAILAELPPNAALAARAHDLRRAIAEEQADRKLLADLNDASLAATTGRGIRPTKPGNPLTFSIDRSVAAYTRVFADYGLVPGTTEPTAAAARVRSRPRAVQDEIVSALMEWYLQGLDPRIKDPSGPWVLKVLAEFGDDTLLIRARDIRRDSDSAKRRARFRELAASLPVATMPARMLMQIATEMQAGNAGDLAVDLLLRAHPYHPGDFWLNTTLGSGLRSYLRPEQVIRFSEAAVVARPRSTTARHNLCIALGADERWEEAAAVTQWLLENDHGSFYRLGIQAYCYERAGRVADAEQCYRQLLQLDSIDVYTLAGLAHLLRRVQRSDEADAFARRAADQKKPVYAAIRQALELDSEGKIDEALAAWARVSAADGDRALAQWSLSRALRLKKLLPRLPAVVAGTSPLRSYGEVLRAWDLCRVTGQPAAAVRLAEAAFAQNPRLARSRRYDAACCAALAAAKDPPLADKAHTWLRSELIELSRQAADDKAAPVVRHALLRWQRDPDLRAVRDPATLAAMAPTDRQRWDALWADAQALLIRVSKSK